MRSDLRTAEDRARALLGAVEHRDLGPLRIAEAVAFARACGERDPRLLDPESLGFQVHTLYLPSLQEMEVRQRNLLQPDRLARAATPVRKTIEVR